MSGSLAEKKDTKVAILFVPEEMQKSYTVLQSLHIHKSARGIDYSILAITRKEVQQHYKALPEEVRNKLLPFQPDQVINVRREAEKQCNGQQADASTKAFVAKAMHRHLYKLFQELRPSYYSLKCYHKIKKAGSPVYQTLPCRFSSVRPKLGFRVQYEKGLFNLGVSVEINEVSHAISAFTRTAFFLQKENEYFQLAFHDFQTLEWIGSVLDGTPGLEQAEFTEKILTRLECDYKVDRDQMPGEKQLAVLPDCRVMFSELNNAFLLMTPQWLYDGILVEGAWKEKQEFILNGERIVVSRHREKEQEFVDLLSSLHPNFSNQRNGYYYVSFAEAQKKQWFIQTYYRLLEMNVEVTGMDMLQHFRYSPHQVETEMTVTSEQGSRMQLEMRVHFGKETVSLATVQKALFAGQRAIVLKNGSLGLLSDEWLERYATLIKHGKVSGSEIQVSRLLLLSEQKPAGEQPLWEPVVKEGWKEQWKRWQGAQEQVIAVPASVKASLRPYQQKGFEWLVLLSQAGAGACLADDMGLGKTLQTICYLAWYGEQNPDSRNIIVCPTSLVYNWHEELKKFAPGLHVEIFHGASRSNVKENAQVIITSYGTLRSNSDWLLSQAFGVVVLDESHNIKNPAAQITRIAHQLEAGIRIALSGTPVVNNTFDLYSQLSFSLPGLFGTREFFKREYADPIDRYGDEAKIKALQKLTAPFILRRTKEQVAKDLPAKTEAVLWCTMSAAQEELYQEIKEQVRSNLFMDIKTNGLNKTKLAVLQGLLKLRQICNDPKLLPAEEHGGRVDSAKVNMLMDELSGLLGRHRVLVFSQFSSMLQLLAKACNDQGIRYFLLDGQTPAEKRMQMVKDFQENEGSPKLFFISLKAGNTGLTLTAADYVFLFDPWWNTAVEQQAIDRTHRIGQTKNVFSYKLVCKNSIEERILELQQRKKALAEELISAEEDFVKSLGEDDIAYLFG